MQQFHHELYEEPEGEDHGIYSQSVRTQMLDEDQISGWEAAFMEGWERT